MDMFVSELEQLPIPLLQWYEEHARKLPWRENPTPYHVLVSEIMLQQTRVVAVLGYYARFLEALPTLNDLAQVEEDRLLKLWQGLGYYNRARNLQKAAKMVMEEFGGQFPTTAEEIRTLSGVGDYTTGAIGSICFGLPLPAVDGNVLRVVARITGDDGDILKSATKKRMTEQLAQIIPTARAGDFNQAMMELGATVCLPNGAPQCHRCPAQTLCVAYQTQQIHKLPVKTPKKPRRIEDRKVFLIFCDRRVAIRRRPERGLLAKLWEFPNELAGEPCPVAGEMAEECGTGRHIFTHIQWDMVGQVVLAQEDDLPEGWGWATWEELQRIYPIPNAFSSFIDVVERYLK